MLTKPYIGPKTQCLESGSVTIIAITLLAVLAFIGASVLLNITRRANGLEKTGGWQEALFAAEAGGDIATANIRWTVVDGSPTAFDTSLGWAKTSSSGNTTYTYTTPIMNQTGEGTTQVWSVVTVDAPTATTPAGLKDTKGNQWYRIRSVGHARVTGLVQASLDTLTDKNARHTNALRKFSLKKDRASGATLAAPEVTRTIEIIVQPKTGFIPALLANSNLHIHDNSRVDSYDSSDPTKSSTIGGLAGQYDVAKFQQNGTIGTNGSAHDSLKIDGSNTRIYGNAGTNGSDFSDPNHEIVSPGQINNSTSTLINPVAMPNWNFSGIGAPQINTSITQVKKDTTLTVSANPANNYYQLSSIEDKTLDIVLPSGVTTGTVNLWITDKMTGAIHIPVGVTVKIYFSGKSFKPKDDGKKNGIDNDNQNAANLQIYGVSRVKQDQKIDIKVHDTSLYASIYAPSGQLKLSSDNKSPNLGFYGSVVGDTIDFTGYFHYDEALNGVGEVIDFTRASYAEDDR